jgi:anti-anti-sigma factor
MSLDIQTIQTTEQDVFRFSLDGRLDNSTASKLEAALQPAIATNPKSIILHLGGLDFISSIGIRVLLETQKTLSAKGGSVLLVDLQPQIQKVLEIIKSLPGVSVFRNTQELDDYLAAIQRRIKAGE